MTKEELEIEHKQVKQELEGLHTEYGKLVSRYRILKAMIHGVMREVDEPETQFQSKLQFPWETLTDTPAKRKKQ